MQPELHRSSDVPVRYIPDEIVTAREGFVMGFLDNIKTTVKSKVGGNKTQVKQGIDKVADTVDDHAGSHADKVQQGADMAKDAVDKLPDA
jgi:hypothetical protein